MKRLYEVKLYAEELLLLNGQVNETAQKIIAESKRETEIGFELPFMNSAILSSEKNGELKWSYKGIRSCGFCGKKYSYQKHTRSGKYHRRGDDNHNKPIYYNGIKFNEGVICFVGSGDICSECLKKYNVIEKLIDYILDHNLKIQIQKNNYKPSRYLKDKIRICFQCGKRMQESKMGDLPAMMGGKYKGKCPHCSAKSLPFGKSHKMTSEFEMIKISEAQGESKN